MQDLILLSFVQGITEFLPISSSLHLNLCRKIFDIRISYNLKLIDVFLHLGTFFAIFIYFYKELFFIIREFFSFNYKNPYFQLAIKLIIATLPCIFVGFLIKKLNIVFPQTLSNINFIFFGILLYVADKKGEKKHQEQPEAAKNHLFKITYKDSFLIGWAQCIAFIPGSSRLGTTITMARFLNINRIESVSFSFLLSLPTIFGAATLTSIDFLKKDKLDSFHFYVIPVTALFGLITCQYFLSYLKKGSLKPFALYRICLGVLLEVFSI
jgi:undecaprenyl-diphosphatase